MEKTDWALWAISLKQRQGQKRTAKRLGISEGTLTHMIFNGAAPSIATLTKIAKTQNKSVWELVREAEELTQMKKTEHSSEERSA